MRFEPWALHVGVKKASYGFSVAFDDRPVFDRIMQRSRTAFVIQVNKDYVELEKEVMESRPKLKIIHGGAESEKVKPKPRVSPRVRSACLRAVAACAS